MYYTIYKTTNKINQKQYIGMHQTNDLNDGYMGSGKLLKRAIDKYGLDAFIHEILYVFDNHEQMVSKEKELVTEEWCKRKDTYNIRKGGKGGFTVYHASKGRKSTDKILLDKYTVTNPSQLTHVRILRRKRFKKWHKEGLFKYSNFRGKKHTEETKMKIGIKNSKNQTGIGNSQFGTMWITNGTENKKIKKVDIIPEGWYKGRKMN